MSEVIFEVVACCTLDRNGERVSLARGARLRLDLDDHDLDERQLRRAVAAGKLRQLPMEAANG